MTYLMSSHERAGRGVVRCESHRRRNKAKDFSSHGGKAEVCSVMGYDATWLLGKTLPPYAE